MVEGKFALGVVVGALAVVLIQADPLVMRLLRLAWLPLHTVTSATVSAFWQLGWEAHLSFFMLAVLAMRARAARQQHSVAVRHRLHSVLRSPWLGLTVPVVLVVSALVVLVAVALTTSPATPAAPPMTTSVPTPEPRGWRGLARRLAAAMRRHRSTSASSSVGGGGAVNGEAHERYTWANEHGHLQYSWGTMARAGTRLMHEVTRAVLWLRPALIGLALQACLSHAPIPPFQASPRPLLGRRAIVVARMEARACIRVTRPTIPIATVSTAAAAAPIASRHAAGGVLLGCRPLRHWT